MAIFAWLAKKPAVSWLPKPRRASSSAKEFGAVAGAQPLRAQPKSLVQTDGASARTRAAPRRELLYATVREALAAAGMPSAYYQAKAVSLDGGGQQFMVLMDVAGPPGIDAKRLNQLEALMVQAVNAQAGITLAGVYWRIDPQALLARTASWPGRAGVAARKTAPGGALPATPATAPASSAAAGAAGARTGQQRPSRMREIFAPIEADELAAFKRAKAKAAGEHVPEPPVDDAGH